MNDFRKDVAAYMNGNKPGAVENSIAIMGTTKATAAQMKAYIAARNKDKKWQDIVDIYLEEGKAEGVKGDVAFAQSCLETGNFKFTGDVTEDQNNFAGIGTTGGGVKGHCFPDVRTGVRAQIQHLLAYASTRQPSEPVVDPRYALVRSAYGEQTLSAWSDLNGRWAVPGYSYGQSIMSIFRAMLTK